MSKNLVLLSDGTGQRGGVGYETNVWRLNKTLVINDRKQLICYDDGAGSERSRTKRIWGGMSAFGLDMNVRELGTSRDSASAFFRPFQASGRFHRFL